MGYLPLSVGEIKVTNVCAPCYWQFALSEQTFILHLAAVIALGTTALALFKGVDNQIL